MKTDSNNQHTHIDGIGKVPDRMAADIQAAIERADAEDVVTLDGDVVRVARELQTHYLERCYTVEEIVPFLRRHLNINMDVDVSEAEFIEQLKPLAVDTRITQDDIARSLDEMLHGVVLNKEER